MSYMEISNIEKAFDKNEVLKGISLNIEQGEFVSLLGPSGCGKSTLLRCLSGLETIDRGTFVLDGKDVTETPAQNRNIGMVFQQYSLFPNMTVEENLSFPLTIQKMPKADQKAKIDDVLEIVGLTDKKKAYPGNLSGGQQQRVALARAIISRPKVLLLDEPLSAIDAKLRKNLQIEIRRIQQELNITTIFVTHTVNECAEGEDTVFWDTMLRHGTDISCFASDDNHNGGTFQDSFGGFVMVKSERLDHESIVTNLLKGNYYSSNGAVITQWGIRNGEVYVDCENAERVNFICGGSIGSSKTVMMENQIPLQHVSIPLSGREQYVRIEVKNTLGQTAWTNPIIF